MWENAFSFFNLTRAIAYSSIMTSIKRSPPFRAEHVGSLLRPQELVQKRYDVASGKAQPDELVPLEDKSVAEVVKFQQECGLKVVSSGEYTRYWLS